MAGSGGSEIDGNTAPDLGEPRSQSATGWSAAGKRPEASSLLRSADRPERAGARRADPQRHEDRDPPRLPQSGYRSSRRCLADRPGQPDACLRTVFRACARGETGRLAACQCAEHCQPLPLELAQQALRRIPERALHRGWFERVVRQPLRQPSARRPDDGTPALRDALHRRRRDRELHPLPAARPVCAQRQLHALLPRTV